MAKRRKGRAINGVLLLDKPYDMSSNGALQKVKRIFFAQKAGHTGALDPLATGLLIICTGKQTKEIHTYQNQVKEYTGTFTLGATTPSYDLETEIDQKFPTEHITEDLLKETTKQFIGDIQQKPPIFSAIKKDGKRLYELARKGETTEIKARIVKVLEFEITTINLPKVDFKVVCSKGTYIRSLASDFGNALNSGAHLSALRRTKIGDFSVDKSNSIEGFIKSLKVE